MKNLDSKYKKSGFYKIPDDYFRDLTVEIMAKNPAITLTTTNYYITFLKFAIPCILIYILSINFLDSNKSTSNLNWKEISEVEIITYLESENISEFDIIKNIESEEKLKKYLENFSIEEEFALRQETINSNEWIELSNYED